MICLQNITYVLIIVMQLSPDSELYVGEYVH